MKRTNVYMIFAAALAFSLIAMAAPCSAEKPGNAPLETPRDMEQARISISEGADTLPFSIIAAAEGDKIKLTKEYANYYKGIRSKIKDKLVSNYIRRYKDGDVGVIFVLKSNGELAELGIDAQNSVPDKDLIEIAMKSVKEASPFPPFPAEMNTQKMPFSLTVSFKKH